MECKTKEIRKFIVLEFKEIDLVLLNQELDKAITKLDDIYHRYSRSPSDKADLEKIREFKQVLINAISELGTSER